MGKSTKKLTTEIFIERAKEVQSKKGREYDYSKVVYVNNKAKVEIICKKHQSFFQKPNSHLNGLGCPECSGHKHLTQEMFIDRSIQIHGKKYDYSQVVYVNTKTKVIISCSNKEHGNFFQSPEAHMDGQGCPECANRIPLTKESFIKKATKIHSEKGNIYDYSKVIFTTSNKNVEIICGEHGPFFQKPRNHLAGKGCVKCGKISCKKSRTFTNEDFIKKANETHNNFYDYSKVGYINSNVKIIITCPIEGHGDFKQTPICHTIGQGCPKCGYIKTIDSKRSNTEEFIEKSIKIHGNKFNYSLVEYVDYYTKVKIVCDKHKIFEQTPCNHLNGNGCPKCVFNNKSKIERVWLDYIGIDEIYRNNRIVINDRVFVVDGIDYDKKIIFEFYGDFFHGNPKKYNLNDMNKFVKKTFGELYAKTMDKEKYILENSDFSLVTIWEKDFREKLKNGEIIIK